MYWEEKNGSFKIYFIFQEIFKSLNYWRKLNHGFCIVRATLNDYEIHFFIFFHLETKISKYLNICLNQFFTYFDKISAKKD